MFVTRRLLAIAILATCCSCHKTRAIYSDFASQEDSSSHDLIKSSPYVVVAVNGEKTRSGPPGLIARRHGWPPFPAQRYRFTLTVRRSLRGDLTAGQTITVFGYETEDLVLIGPPQGVCGWPGELAVYFLRKQQGSFRVMVDNRQIRMPLDKRTDLNVVEPSDTIPVSIWRLSIYPFQAGLKSATSAEILNALMVPMGELGTARSISLLSEAMDRSGSRDFQVKACIELGSLNLGFGVEGCARRLRNEPFVTAAQRATVQDLLDKTPVSNARMRSVLASGDWSQIGFWARAREQDPQTIREFLSLMSRYPDHRIAQLAGRLLAKRPHDPPK